MLCLSSAPLRQARRFSDSSQAYKRLQTVATDDDAPGSALGGSAGLRGQAASRLPARDSYLELVARFPTKTLVHDGRKAWPLSSPPPSSPARSMPQSPPIGPNRPLPCPSSDAGTGSPDPTSRSAR